MKESIIKQLKEKIEICNADYGNNYIAKEFNKTLDTDEAKKQVDSADFNMAEVMKKKEWLEQMLKSLE
jgi:uncharacterized protein Smg (DUF494 family)